MKNTSTLIGITGNIATGKSVVRRMLANAGALGLDADIIGHRMIYPQGPAFQDVLEAFGDSILNENSEISRAKLGKIVFKNPDQLAKLEAVVHPAVASAIQERLAHSNPPLAALEAIKLLEAGLGEICDTIWVSHTPRTTQVERLLQTRGLTEDEVWARINAQPPQEEKLARADVVIHTDGPFKHTWSQVCDALNDTIHLSSLVLKQDWRGPAVHQLPSEELVSFWVAQTGKGPEALYQRLGLGKVQPLTQSGQLKALLLWEDWNFTGVLHRVLPDDFFMANFDTVIEAFQASARRQGCEIILLPDELVKLSKIKPGVLNFEQRNPGDLPYLAWRLAAERIRSQAEGLVWAQILAKPLETKNKLS
jgi:dephospho-CoA kinase